MVAFFLSVLNRYGHVYSIRCTATKPVDIIYVTNTQGKMYKKDDNSPLL